MKNDLKKSIFNTFSKFPNYEFIVKLSTQINDKKYFEHIPNVHVFKWVNQKAILRLFYF